MANEYPVAAPNNIISRHNLNADPKPMTARGKARASTTTAFKDRIGDAPPLPGAWNHRHDRALCVLEFRNYSYNAMVSKMRRAYPELEGVLTSTAIEKRLRQLDQDVEVKYWQEAIEMMDREEEARSLGLPNGIQSAQSAMSLNTVGGQTGAAATASPRVRPHTLLSVHIELTLLTDSSLGRKTFAVNVDVRTLSVDSQPR